jgi:phosphoglycerate dehydrogenase-like enzyme
MMERQIALGVPWAGLLLDRLKAALQGWSIRSGAQSDTEMARSATVLIPFGMRVGRELLAGSRIRLVQQFGVGVDGIDLAAARDLGIPVTNAPSEVSGMAGTVAEGAILLVLACARLPSVRQDNLAAGRWSWTMPLNLGLAGKTAGIVGLGSIGKAIARRLAAFEMRLVAVRRSARTPDPLEDGFEWVGEVDQLDQLIAESDFIIICAPLTPETRGLFSETLLGKMKPGASLVNVGRGAIVDEDALLRALDAGRMHAVGLDTIQAEPPPPNSRLLTHPRVVLTPHDAGASDVVFHGLTRIIADNLRRLEASEPLLFRIA